MFTVCVEIPQHDYSFWLYWSRHIFCTEWTVGVNCNAETSSKNVISFLKNPKSYQKFTILSQKSDNYRNFASRKGRLNIPLVYFHRYLRLTPLLGISILFTVSLLRFLGNGPLWPSIIDAFSERCERHWWTTLLYVQNYVNPSDLVSCFFFAFK